MRGFFLLVVDFFLLESFLLDVALRAVPLDLGLVACGAFLAGVFLPEPGARVVIVSDLAMGSSALRRQAAVELCFFAR